ncbi:hypothetical protein D3C71_1348020 [compost metagenome]
MVKRVGAIVGHIFPCLFPFGEHVLPRLVVIIMQLVKSLAGRQLLLRAVFILIWNGN